MKTPDEKDKTEHTPTPWVKKSDARGIYLQSEVDPESHGGELAEIFRYGNLDLAEANAELIIRAVNSHEALLDVLKGLLEVGEHIDLFQGLRMDAIFVNAFTKARKLLAAHKRP